MNNNALARHGFLALLYFVTSLLYGQSNQILVVSPAGDGDFKTIQAAINSLPSFSSIPRRIFIKSGIYREKIFLEKSNIILEGEGIDRTTLLFSIARDEWRCEHPDDWGVATLNIAASDITLLNLTITNEYGFKNDLRTIACAGDTSLVDKLKSIRKDGHQMAVRVMNTGTRMRAFNCKFRSYGGDTMSPWEVNNGMWYFKNCLFEGGVDFYCPRGWAWAENCSFYSHTGSAAIWHDGSGNKDAKSIFLNCRFDGYQGFLLGRYHRESQFYLINCSFSSHMRDSSIYLVPTKTPIEWGERVYFFNCHREGGADYSWYKNRLPDSLLVKDITPNWLFTNRWSPEKFNYETK